jgi:hypothetical protein
MRAFVLAAFALCFFQPWTTSQGPGDSLKTLYEQHHWFALRDATTQANAPPFYRAAVEAAFDEVELAERDLGQLIVQSPHSADAYEAHQLLATMSSDASTWADGNLGIDLLNEARSTTLDFGNMTLILQ